MLFQWASTLGGGHNRKAFKLLFYWPFINFPLPLLHSITPFVNQLEKTLPLQYNNFLSKIYLVYGRFTTEKPWKNTHPNLYTHYTSNLFSPVTKLSTRQVKVGVMTVHEGLTWRLILLEAVPHCRVEFTSLSNQVWLFLYPYISTQILNSSCVCMIDDADVNLSRVSVCLPDHPYFSQAEST